MRNILARGGIEFIAVFLGIALSFYVEEWQDTNKQKDLLNKDCKNILLDVNEDIGTINNVIESNKDDLNKLGIFKVDLNFHSDVKATISIKIDKIESK